MPKKLLQLLIISSIVSAVLTLFFLLGLFASWQNKLSDTLFSGQTPREDIVIIAVDDASLQRIGRWPWSRITHASLIEKLSSNPKAIGIDISFLEPENQKADGTLAEALKKASNATLASEDVNGKILTPISILQENSKTGIVNLSSGTDGITRHAMINKDFPHFAIKIIESANEKVPSLPLEGNLLRINFAGPPNTFPTYSYADVLEGLVPPDNFKNKIVLIGATAPDLHDNQTVPTSQGTPMSGVEIQANVIQTILNKDFLIPEKNVATIAVIFALSLLTAVVLNFTNIFAGIFITLCLAIFYIIFSILAFDSGIIKNLIFPLLAILLTAIADIVHKYLTESKQKRFIKKAFSYYLSEPVLHEVLKNPSKLSLGGERKELTVLFSDIANFTTMSEQLNPDKLARLLNQYLTEMTNIVFNHRGVLDKFIGDAVMAFWGAPIKESNHAFLACQTALKMQESVNSIKSDWAKEGVENFCIRIGINTGEMIVGNMGSQTRFDYTLIGDNVNLGSRLEGINKVYGTKIIISERTQGQVKNEFVTRKLDIVAVKGKKKCITIYELRSIGKPSIEEQKLLNNFEEARLLYENGKFQKSKKSFENLLKKYPADSPTKIYIERCKNLIKNKPLSWDGIYKAETK